MEDNLTTGVSGTSPCYTGVHPKSNIILWYLTCDDEDTFVTMKINITILYDGQYKLKWTKSVVCEHCVYEGICDKSLHHIADDWVADNNLFLHDYGGVAVFNKAEYVPEYAIHHPNIIVPDHNHITDYIMRLALGSNRVESKLIDNDDKIIMDLVDLTGDELDWNGIDYIGQLEPHYMGISKLSFKK